MPRCAHGSTGSRRIFASTRSVTHAARHIGGDRRLTWSFSFPWFQPYPDALLDVPGTDSARPDARLVSRQTIELAFLATIQCLPARQRAVLILRDILDFSATETAALLDDTTAAVNSALQRARATIRKRRAPAGGARLNAEATFDEAVLLQGFMDAQERGDIDAIVDLLREDVRMTLFPEGTVWDGRRDVECEFFRMKSAFDGDVRSMPTAANRQPALAVYSSPAGRHRVSARENEGSTIQRKGSR